MRDIKLLQMGLGLAQLLPTRHKFVCFRVTSHVDIDCARSSLCQARYSSVMRASEWKSEGCGLGLGRETDFISLIKKP